MVVVVVDVVVVVEFEVVVDDVLVVVVVGGAANVATTALQLVLELRLNIPTYDPADITAAASLAARDVPVSCRCSVYPLPAIAVPV